MNHDREEAARQQQATETMLRMRDPKSGDIRDALRERNAAERELSCRDALIRDHLAKIMHLENRVDAEAHRAEHAEAQLEDMRACAEDWSVQANRMAIEAAKAEAKLDATVGSAPAEPAADRDGGGGE